MKQPAYSKKINGKLFQWRRNSRKIEDENYTAYYDDINVGYLRRRIEESKSITHRGNWEAIIPSINFKEVDAYRYDLMELACSKFEEFENSI